MPKSAKSIRRICIASIKRHTIKSINYPLTRIYETEELNCIDEVILNSFDIWDDELPIVMTFVDIDNWTLITTKRIASSIEGDFRQAEAHTVKSYNWNDFKGYNDKQITYGKLDLTEGSTLNVIIETGKASMIMISAITTLVGQLTSETKK